MSFEFPSTTPEGFQNTEPEPSVRAVTASPSATSLPPTPDCQELAGRGPHWCKGFRGSGGRDQDQQQYDTYFFHYELLH
ncbi:MAG: hypothetical protein U5N26_09330 [Candidatus Marinimicrobia bacterium]|nr:hypothetical protein [Candidatus Neomarinimicrobiota bacterium]